MVGDVLISIVIPVFNTERFLKRCIESVISQTYQNIEVILVDDGSTDLSGSICDEYANKDSRIKVIHQKNSGPVTARKEGLKIATGKYLGFVDSDDYIMPQMYEKLYECILFGEYDIVWCDVIMKYSSKQSISKLDASEDSSILLKQLLKGQYPGWMCNKLISFDFYNRCEIFQDPSCSMMEDVLVMIQLLSQNPKLKHVNEALYIYDKTNENAMTAGDVFGKALQNINHIEHFLIYRNLFKQYEQEFSFFAMKAKIYLLNAGKFYLAKKYFPYAHKQLKNYPLTGVILVIYFLFFNMGKLGYFLFFIYSNLVRKEH